MTRILQIIIKFIRKISKMSIKSLIKLILDLISGKNIIFSLLQIFKWLSFLFTLIFLINDSLAKNLVEIFNLNIFDNIKILWNKIISLILKIINYFKFNEDENIPEPKMLSDNNLDKNYQKYYEDIIKENNKNKNVKVIIQDGTGKIYDDNWNWKWKILFILGLWISGFLIITIVGNNVIEIIKVPFIWTYDHLIHPIYAFFGIIYTFLAWFFRGGGDPDRKSVV